MCKSPLKILNRSKSRTIGLDSKYLYVPCGHCPDCQKRKQNDLFIRSYYEYEYTKKVGGFTQMFTLTYSDDCLPFCTTRHIPCFSREDITLFLKRVRQALCRKYRISVSDLRYNLVCEYGGLRQRPHYHVNFSVNNPVVKPSAFKNIVRSAWSYGFISTTSICDGVINSLSGLRYVSKYCSKDTNTYNFFLSELDWLKKNSPDEVKQLKHCMPFNRRSIHFGDYALNPDCKYYINDFNLRTRSISIPEYHSGMAKFSLPLHYIRKCLYNQYYEVVYNDKEKRNIWKSYFFLNDKGISFLKDKYKKILDSQSDTFNSLVATLTPECLDFVNLRMQSTYTLSGFREYVTKVTDNFCSDFINFAVLYAPYLDIVHFGLHNDFVNIPIKSRDFTPSIIDEYCEAISFKENNFLLSRYGVEQENNFKCDFLHDLYLQKLLSLLLNLKDKVTPYVHVLSLLDFVLEFKNKFENKKLLEFEKSALFRRYVYNY